MTRSARLHDMSHSSIVKRMPLIALAALLPACSSGPTEPAPARPAASLQVSVFLPVPVTQQTAADTGTFRQALRTIRAAIPGVTTAGLFLDARTSGVDDWLALLNTARDENVQLVIGFADVVGGFAEQGFRPERINGLWQLGPLGEFFACHACATHPALYAVLSLDEPWHPTKRPVYTTADLQDLYTTLKSRSPTTPIMVAFSRQIWKHRDDPRAHYESGMADIVQISALEFQDGAYQFDLLDQNHYWSRRVVREKTPTVPLWTTVQVMGNRLGPAAGYWFPRADDLTRMLNDVTASKYEDEFPLTGIAFQKWDSENPVGRTSQFTLGDSYLPAQPGAQVSASGVAIEAINAWLNAR